MTNNSQPEYTVGRTEAETRRLIQQAELYEQHSRQWLTNAGLRPGMKVLDIGTGAGDVAFLAAEFVGPNGSVVGTDVNPLVLETARSRGIALGLANVAFVEGDFRTMDLPTDFDAITDRNVLLYQSDPFEALTAAVKHVRSQGIVAIQEIDFRPLVTYAQIAKGQSYARTVRWINRAFEETGTYVGMGFDLPSAYLAASCTTPRMASYAPMGGPPEWSGFDYWVETVRSIAPLLEKLGLASPEELALTTLRQTLVDEVRDTGSPIQLGTFVAAWGSKL
jgi:SAM-dependent methyltransferase